MKLTPGASQSDHKERRQDYEEGSAWDAVVSGLSLIRKMEGASPPPHLEQPGGVHLGVQNEDNSTYVTPPAHPFLQQPGAKGWKFNHLAQTIGIS